jgi:hypothetical protein
MPFDETTTCEDDHDQASRPACRPPPGDWRDGTYHHDDPPHHHGDGVARAEGEHVADHIGSIALHATKEGFPIHSPAAALAPPMPGARSPR